MQRTANIYARVEPEVKEQAETVLSQLGIPISSAIGMFLRQIILHKGIPFEMKLPIKHPLCLDDMTKEEFDAELQKGYDDVAAGRTRDAREAFADMKRKYGI